MRRESTKDTDHERFLRLDDLNENLPHLVFDGSVFQKEFLVRLLPNHQCASTGAVTSRRIYAPHMSSMIPLTSRCFRSTC